MWTQGFACSRATLQSDDLSEVRHHNDKELTVFEWNRTGWTGFNDRARSRVDPTLLRKHTATEPNLDDQVEARFGSCAYFLIVDTKKGG